MATAAVARPAQPPRRSRDAPRPTATKRSAVTDASSMQSNKKRKLDEPLVWDSPYILTKHANKPPSLIIHLHPTHFKFEGQDGSFAYDSEMKFVLEHLKRQTVPHQMMLELLENNVAFYDGCLIVEVQNHRRKEGKGGGSGAMVKGGDREKFSMHRYTPYITPSAYVAFPENAARGDETPDKGEAAKQEMPAPEKPKEREGPQVYTVVLHPTDLSRHHEMCILAETPAEQVRNNKKRGSEAATPSAAQSGSVPPTPITQTARTQGQKMCLEEGDMYSFQADVLVTTNPPLYLAPVDNPFDSQKVLDMLQHPLHQEQPPSPKTRKRTTAEVAADDALHQETERRMLIMDERIVPRGAGVAANENQGAAASLTFSRFKTIDLVKAKLEEAERLKKEEDLRASQEKKQADEQAQAAATAQRAATIARNRMLQQQQANMNQQQQAMMLRQQQEHMRLQAMTNAQQAQMGHGHPQQNGIMGNQQQNMQQGNQVQMTQASPVVRQQTPMMNSSPMVQQGGFPMVQTSSQGAGSPPRPTSAAMQQHPMARQVSQQQQGSRNATPHMPHGTPNMVQAMPNRQMTQTPRMPPGSPANGMQQGTPNMNSMPMQTPQMGGLTPEQIAMIQAQRAMAQQPSQALMQAGSPAHNMTPEQILSIQNQSRQQQAQQQQQQQQQQQLRQSLMAAQAQANAGNPQAAAAQQMAQRHKLAMLRQQQLAQQNSQMQGSPGPGQAGSPGQMLQQTPQMNHAHPGQQQFHNQQQNGNMQDMTPQQRAHAHQLAQARAHQLAQARAPQLAQNRENFQQQQVQQQQLNAAQLQAQRQQIIAQLQPLSEQYGGLNNIPHNILNTLPPPVKSFVAQQLQTARQQNALRMQQAAVAQQAGQQQGAQGGQGQNQQGGGGGTGVEHVPAGQPNPAFMQQLRSNHNQAMLMHQQQQQQQQQQVGGMNGMQGMAFQGQGGGMQGFGGGGGQGGGSSLDQQFAAMQNALARENRGGGGQ